MIHTFDFYPIDSRMYILPENKKALIIDPCVSDQALQLLQENEVEELLILPTHEHYDHISGINWLREHIPSVNVLCSSTCAAALPEPSKNLSNFWEVLFIGKDEETQQYVKDMDIHAYSCTADNTFDGELNLSWEGHSLFLKETPGHSKGSCCILLDGTILFSGDSLVTGFPVITRLPGGNKKEYAGITLPYLQTLDPGIMVYPGHGEQQALGKFLN